MRVYRAWAAWSVACAIASMPLYAQVSPESVKPSSERLRLSISTALFQGIPEPLIMAIMKPFEALLIAQTGMHGDMVSAGNGAGVMQQVMDGKVHVGVVEGIEYAWHKHRFPQLRPLVISIN